MNKEKGFVLNFLPFLIPVCKASCTGDFELMDPRFADLIDGSWARDHYQLNSGSHVINPGGVNDLFRDTSGDRKNCRLNNDEWICGLKDYQNCGPAGVPTGSAAASLSINNNVMTFDTSINSFADYCYYCTNIADS